MKNLLHKTMIEVFDKLINEVVPSDKIIYRTLDGRKITATEMIKEIRNETELGIMYSTEVLSITRDFLSRESNK